MALQQYKLSLELLGHEADVRIVCSLPNGFVCTGSRDRAIRIWDPSSPQAVRTLYAHQHYLASLTPLNPSNEAPSQFFASGGNDKVIYVWDSSSFYMDISPIFTLIGHNDTVCALASSASGEIISGSWDKTARIWNGGQCVQELKGHDQAVWAVLSLPNGDIVTGSADRTIKVWRGTPGHMQCISTLQKHTDCVRGLALVPEIGFVSCGNDGLVILWSFSGEVLQELHGHTAFVYSVAVLPDSRIVSCGEDRSVRVWENGECVQALIHPATVWSVATLGNGDILSGGSDGVARIWTRDAARVADASTLDAYDKSLATTAIHSKTVGDIQLDKLPAVDSLATPGTKDGENKIVRVGNGAEAYTWSSGDNKWIKIGEVVDSGPTGKQELFGKEYDYVFDVELDEGGARKIGYNNGDNPYLVAQEFLWREELGQEHLDVVAKFLIKNTSSTPMVIESSPVAGDPFTGNRREAGDVRPAGGAEAQVSTSCKHIPQRVAVLFEGSNLAGLFQKLEEFSMKEERTLLSDDNKRALPGLQALLRDTSKYHASKLGADQYQLIAKLLSWPTEYLLPVLDLLRLLLLHPNSAEVFATPNNMPGKRVDVLQVLLDLLASKPQHTTNCMLALRALANMFSSLHTRKLLDAKYEAVLQGVGASAALDNRTALAAATVLLNYGVFNLGNGKNGNIKNNSLLILKELLLVLKQKLASAPTQPESDVLVRVFVAVGTLIWQDQSAMHFAKSIELKTIVGELMQNSTDATVNACLQELMPLL